MVQVSAWKQWGWLRHGFSTRVSGVSDVYGAGELNLGLTKEDDGDRVGENRRRFLREVDGESSLITVRQVHGVGVSIVREGYGAGEAEAADGLVTAEPGLMLGIQVADCVPVLLVDVRRRVVAALHAGWRGTTGRIVEHGIGRMREEFQCEPRDIVAAVGPSIGRCCYRVGEELRASFSEEFFDLRDGRFYLDLWEANKTQLIGAGLRAEQVTVLGECTACARVGKKLKYFSHRAERGVTGRSMGVIGMGKRSQDY